MQHYTQCTHIAIIIMLTTLAIESMKLEPSKQKLPANQDCYFAQLDKDVLLYLLSHCLSTNNNQKKSLKHDIATYLQLKKSCTYFHSILTPHQIGTYCKNYSLDDKRNAFIHLIAKKSCHDSRRIVVPTLSFIKIKTPTLILAHAGADNAKTYILRKATEMNNKELIIEIVRHETNPNEAVKSPNNDPVFFGAQTPEIAETFAAYKVDLTQPGNDGFNVLWHQSKSLEIFKFYLDHGIDACSLCAHSGDCLLHHCVRTWYDLEIIDLLIKTVPDMINIFNKYQETPTDVAESRCGAGDKEYSALLRSHGGLTAQECKQKAVSLKCKRYEDEDRFDCIIS